MSTARQLLSAAGIFTLLTVLPMQVDAADAGGMPAPRQVPGLTSADKHPNGCVDCHIVYKDRGHDERLSVKLKAWTAGNIEPGLLAQTKASMPAGVAVKGKHPEAEDSLEDIPAACLDCHDSGSKKAPPFARLLHLVHLKGDAKNPFMSVYQGECTHCHKLNAKTGEWSLASGPEK